MDRALAVGRLYRWRLDTRAGAWVVVGRPDLRLVAVTVSRGRGRVSPAWRVEPGGTIYENYMDAMLAVETYAENHPKSRR